MFFESALFGAKLLLLFLFVVAFHYAIHLPPFLQVQFCRRVASLFGAVDLLLLYHVMKKIQEGLVVHFVQSFIFFFGVPGVRYNIRYAIEVLAPQIAVLRGERLRTLTFINDIVYLANAQHALLLLYDLHRVIIALKTRH